MTISVALCTFNGAAYIKDQLNSLLNQSKTIDEIIICDDCSTDSTLDILETYALKFPQIRLYKNALRLGYIKNFDKAINLCTKDIIFLSDQDDVWNQDKIHLVCNKYKTSDAIGIFTNAEIVDESLNSIGITMFEKLGFDSNKELQYRSNQKEFLMSHYLVTGCTLSFKREYVSAFSPIPENSIFVHDGWIATILSFKGKLEFINQSLVFYRQHSNNSIGAFSSAAEYPTQKIQILKHIVDRNYTRESILLRFFNNKKMTEEFKFVQTRIEAYLLIKESSSFLKRLSTIVKVNILREIAEFRTVRSYIGNSFIFLFQIK